MTYHIYAKIYHNISGDLMRDWIPSIPSFRRALWNKVTNGVTVELSNNQESNDGNEDQLFHIDIAYELFRTFGFLDNTEFCTTTPSIGVRRRIRF